MKVLLGILGLVSLLFLIMGWTLKKDVFFIGAVVVMAVLIVVVFYRKGKS